MEKIASSSPYQYGKIRIWGTIGYATGSWLAGMIYQLISPSAIFICFISTMILCIIGLLGTQTPSELGQNNEEKTKTSTLFHNYKYLYLIICCIELQIWLFRILSYSYAAVCFKMTKSSRCFYYFYLSLSYVACFIFMWINITDYLSYII